MGLYSMPSAADAFLPLALLPLVLLRDGLWWVAIHFMASHRGDDEGEAFEAFDRTGDARGAGRGEGVRVARFQSVCGKGETEWCCCVCLRGFEEEEDVSQVVACRHFFHRECLGRWMEHDHSTCPLCRSQL